MLTSAEYDSAKRTTFNAFYTSPTVITAMHEALARLGVPAGATVLEPGCGIGNFMVPGKRYIGVELDTISGRIAKALHPQADIRIENFRDSRLPEIDAVIGNVPFADLKLDYRGQRLSLHDYLFRQVHRSIKARRRAGIGYQPNSRWISRTPPSGKTWPPKPISSAPSACPATLSSGRAPPLSPTSSSCANALWTSRRTMSIPNGSVLASLPSKGPTCRSTTISSIIPTWFWAP